MAERGERCFTRPFKNKRIYYERVEKFISPVYFSDVNLYSKLYPVKSSKPEFLGHFSAGESRFMQYDEVMQQSFSPVKVGDSFGPSWSTHWFKVKFHIPISWRKKEVRFRWNSSSEAMVWQNGKPCQGLTGGDGQVRTDYSIATMAEGGERVELLIEMAANGMFGTGKDSTINPPDPSKRFTLSIVEFAVFNREAYNVIHDLKLLLSIIKNLSDDNQRGWQALYIANDVVNCFQPETDNSYTRAFKILDGFFSQRNGDSQHLVHAVGHCHIDTAWLWPFEETIRKCARSWSSAIGLMKRYPDFKFVCSQAQQLEWVKEHYPPIYEEVKYFVKKGQFILVGGTWVEMDGNLPSGESFVRQFLYGQRFFEKEFGKKCDVFWLPDTFGYSAQLPQVMKQCGIRYFVTQKLSWNLINKFPHSTFLWEGIDGTRCLTHFPPAETYESNGGADDVLKSSTNNKDKGHVNDSLLLYGFGDGGGGPTYDVKAKSFEDMIESLQRMKDVDGIPRVKLSHPLAFFERIESVSDKLNVWVEELYLELHQGTFTTNAKVKKLNRECETHLQYCELFHVIKLAMPSESSEPYSSKKLLDAWKLLLLNQFHDVLPGTSIPEVNNTALKYYDDLRKMTGTFEMLGSFEKLKNTAVMNALSWKTRRVFKVPRVEEEILVHSQISEKNLYVILELPASGFAKFNPQLPQSKRATVKLCESQVILENGNLLALFDKSGRIISLEMKNSQSKEVFDCNLPGNQYVLFDDIPLYWDAWDIMPYYKETRKPLNDAFDLSVTESGPLRASFQVSIEISEDSFIKQTIILDIDSHFIKFEVNVVNWKENRKFLRVEFPVNVYSQFATYEIQFGHVRRPTHRNTSWDCAKFEVCGQKWVDLSEHDFGVALLNDSKYGFSVTGNTMSISLLRSPKAPDDTVDMGSHSFTYAVMPHTGTFQSAGVIQRAYELNARDSAFIVATEDPSSLSLFHLSSPAVIMETIKKAEDIENAIIVRLYEAYGGRVSTSLTSSLRIERVARCNLLEELMPDMELAWDTANGCKIDFKPFEIITLLIYIG